MTVTRDKSGRLLPGSSSLNPGGRPRTPEHVKAMLGDLTELAVLALEQALEGEDPKLRLTAAQEVLNRALGRPHTNASIDIKPPDNGKAFLEALIAMNAKPTKPVVIDAEATPVAGLPSAAPLAIENNHGDE